MTSALNLPRGPLMIDIAGTTLTQLDRERLCHPLVGGIILFSRNYESPEQLSALCAEVKALRSPQLLIAIDHEGGRVQRCRPGFTAIPAMGKLGALWDAAPGEAIAAAQDLGYVLAAELRARGVDFSFTPVLDLDYPEDSDCDTDMNVIMTGSGGLVEIQGTAEGEPFTRAQMSQLVDMAEAGISTLIAKQKETLAA